LSQDRPLRCKDARKFADLLFQESGKISQCIGNLCVHLALKSAFILAGVRTNGQDLIEESDYKKNN